MHGPTLSVKCLTSIEVYCSFRLPKGCYDKQKTLNS